MLLESLIPLQNTLRDPEQIHEMVEFVKEGGFFTSETLSSFLTTKRKDSSLLFNLNPIKIVQFEDGLNFLHDGLHRSTAIWIAGRKILDPREFVVENWTYKEYLEINLSDKWYTPFDPRKEVRVNDFLAYKRLVEDFINKDPRPIEEEIRRFILDHYEAKSYTEPRSAKSIADVASRHTATFVAVD